MSSTKKNSTKRVNNDFYPTPGWCVDRLLESAHLSDPFKPIGHWLEPGAGDGALIKAVNAKTISKPTWTAIELQDRFKSDLEPLVGPQNVLIENYLKSDLYVGDYNVIITNPPFSLALEFIKKSIELRPNYVCMLLRLNFLGSHERSSFLRKYTPDVYVLPNRPAFVSKKTDSIEYAWFVWEKKKAYGSNGFGSMTILNDTPVNLRK